MDERIKRAAKNRPVKSASSTRIVPTITDTVPLTEDVESDYKEENEEIPEQEDEEEEMTNNL